MTIKLFDFAWGRRTKGAKMVGICETCDRMGDLFQLPGRDDSNCDECSSDIETVISFVALMKEADRAGESTDEMETQVKPIIQKLIARCAAGSQFLPC
jgi:hypothetical protein